MELRPGRTPGSSPSHPVAAYAGVYVDSLYGRQTGGLEGGHLTLRMGAGEVADLSHWCYDTFLSTWRDPLFGEVYPVLVVFSLDDTGRVNGLTARINRDVVRSTRVAEP